MAHVTSLLRVFLQVALLPGSFEFLDESGKEFLLPFPVIPGAEQSGHINMYVSGDPSTSVTVRIPGQSPQTHSVGASTTMITLPTSVEYNPSGTAETMGVLVQSPSDITVSVIRGSNNDEEGFLAIPKTPWSTEYVVISYTPVQGSSSYFTIAAFEDGTDVEMIFRKTGTGDCNTLPVLGEPLTITLQSQQVWGIHCSEIDLTGTFIRSTKPVAVVSGSTVKYKSGSWEPYFFMEEMLIPKIFFGRKFVLPTVSGTAAVLRLVASANDTTIYADGAIFTFLNAGDYHDLRTDIITVMCINGTQPFQVALLGKDAVGTSSPYSADGVVGDAFMVLVPPVESFKKSYHVEVFYVNNVYVPVTNLVFLVEIASGGDLSSSVPWTNLNETSICCGYAAVYMTDDQDTAINFVVSKDYSFGVMLIGELYGSGYSFLIGTSLDPPTCPVGYTYLSASRSCVQQYTSESQRADALYRCENQRSTLVKLNTVSAINDIKTHLASLLPSHSFWIGLTGDLAGEYRWTDGEVVDLVDWVMGEPGNGGQCVVLTNSPHGPGWSTFNCADLRGFVCQVMLADTTDRTLFVECTELGLSCPAELGYSYLRTSEICIRQTDTPLSWIDANAACRSTGDHLVTVDAESKSSDIQTLYSHIWDAYHIGASWHNISDVQWVWTDCSPLVYTRWGVGLPNVSQSDCVAAHREGSWYNVPCNDELMFVCEKPPTNATAPELTAPNDGSCEEMVSPTVTSLYTGMLTSSSDASPDDPSFDTSMNDRIKATSSVPNEGRTVSSILAEPQTSHVQSVDSASDFSSNDYSPPATLDLTLDHTSSEYLSTTTQDLTSNDINHDYLSTTTLDLTSNDINNNYLSTTTLDLTSNDMNHDYLSTTTQDLTSNDINHDYLSTTTLILTSNGVNHGYSSPTTLDLTSDHKSNTYLATATESLELTSNSGADILSSPLYGRSTIETSTIQSTESYGRTAIPVQSVPDPRTGDVTTDNSITRVCRCICIPKSRLEHLTPEAVVAKDKEIKGELLLNTKTLTKTIRKLTSAKDYRKSASGIGALGIVIIVFTACIIFGSDITSLFQSRSAKTIPLKQ